MKMVDGVALVVDAFEGTMPQTRFVLQKALEQKLTPIVIVNKIDRPNARPTEVVYASAINGLSGEDPDDITETMDPVFDAILKYIPAPKSNQDEPFQFQVALLDYNDYVGRVGIGRVFRGRVKVGDNVVVLKKDG